MTASLVFPESTDRTLGTVAQVSEASSATGVPSCRQCASDKSDITPEQRESAIDRAQRRARVHKESFTAAVAEYVKTNNPSYLHVAVIHKVRGEECERLANELIEGRQ